MANITTAQLKQAIQLREQIDALQTKLDTLLNGDESTTIKRKVGRLRGKRTMSSEARAKIAAAQKARWAKARD